MKRFLKVLTVLLISVFLSVQVASAHSGSDSSCLWLEQEKEAFKSKDAVYLLIPHIGLLAAVLFITDSIGCAIEKSHHSESSPNQSSDGERNQVKEQQTP